MTKYLPILALLALPACLGSGGESTVQGTGGVDASLNNDFGSLMNGVRTGSNLTYSPVVAQAAQQHASDMAARNYDSIEVMGRLDVNGVQADIGTILVEDYGYDWSEIGQLIARGDLTLPEVLGGWTTTTANCNSATIPCIQIAEYEDFGIAKAGSGAAQRWVLVLATER